MRGCSQGGEGHVSLLRGACVVAQGACVVAPGGGAMRGCSGGHAWLLWGGRCVVAWGACVVALGGGWVWLLRGHAWLLGGVRGCSEGHAWLLWGEACVGYDEIRSMSGRYASYWNAFLFILMSS